MADWRRVKKELEAEAKRIQFKAPEEVLKIFKYGLIESGAGSYGQYFTTMVFAEGDCRSLAYYGGNNLVVLAEEPQFDLEHLKVMARTHLPLSAEFLGYCGLKRLWELVQDVLSAMDTLKTKEDFKELINSLNLYIALLHGWIHHYFPWNIGELFPQQSPAEIQAMARLAGRRVR